MSKHFLHFSPPLWGLPPLAVNRRIRARSTSRRLVEQLNHVHPEQRGLPVTLAENPARLLIDGWPHEVHRLITGRRRLSPYLDLRPGAEPFVMLGEAGDNRYLRTGPPTAAGAADEPVRR